MLRSDIYLQTWLAVLTEAASRHLNIRSSRSGLSITSPSPSPLYCSLKIDEKFHYKISTFFTPDGDKSLLNYDRRKNIYVYFLKHYC